MKRLSTIAVRMCCALMIGGGLQNPGGALKPKLPNQMDIQSILERQAVTNLQQVYVSELDSRLPKIPFSEWIRQQIGSKAGLIWQLSECGNQAIGGDISACSEINASLPDNRKIILMITIGGFKKGVYGNPAFFYGVIDKDGEIYEVPQLSELPAMLRGELSKSSKKNTQSAPVQLPAVSTININQAVADSTLIKTDILSGSEASTKEQIPDAPPPVTTTLRLLTVADAIVKVNPQYPVKARKFNAQGAVDVQISISQQGKVTYAKAISGNPLLHEAAINAARQWTFKSNLATEITVLVLTFDFKIPQ